MVIFMGHSIDSCASALTKIGRRRFTSGTLTIGARSGISAAISPTGWRLVTRSPAESPGANFKVSIFLAMNLLMQFMCHENGLFAQPFHKFPVNAAKTAVAENAHNIAAGNIS